jgi:sulfite exporter TauE/SafE
VLSVLVEPVLDACPALRRWRESRLGAVAILVEGASGLFLLIYYTGLTQDVQNHASTQVNHLIETLFRIATYTILGSGTVALIGLIADRKKTPSIIALASLFPLLVLVGI